jgi:hypothetical protein
MIFSTLISPRRASSVLRLAAAGLVVASLSCATPSSSSGPAPSAPSSDSSSSASIKSASPVPSASPLAAVCRYGSGTLETECRRRSEQFEADVNAAIDRLAEHHPEYFDIADAVGPGEWRVLQPRAYLAGVVDELRKAGFCAETDEASVVSVKNSNDLSEDYNILLPTEHVQRGNRVYQQTCTPAAFPVEAKDAIAYVRVAFYSIQCEDGITAPRNGANELPFGCRAFVTATPKQRNNEDVPRYIVGNDITWWMEKGSDKVIVHEYPDGNDFNKILVPQNVGAYQLCASSHGVVGCQDAEVLPAPR